MGRLKGRIEEKQKTDRELLEDSYQRLADAVLGKGFADRKAGRKVIAKNVIDEILGCFHFRPVDIPETVKSAEEAMDYSLRQYGIMRREIELADKWYKDSYGPILAFGKEDEIPYVLHQGIWGGYTYRDLETGKYIRIDHKNARLFETEAYCFYRPLPQKKLGIYDLLKYMKSCISIYDIIQVTLAAFAVTVTGMMLPRLTKALTGPILESESARGLVGAVFCIIFCLISMQLFKSVKGLAQKRLSIKYSISVESAMMMRIMSLRTGFFRDYSPGELKSRFMSVNRLCSLLLEILMSSGLTAIMAVLYLFQVFRFAPMLLHTTLIIVLTTVIFSIIIVIIQVRVNRRRLEYSAKESGLSYSMISGIQKIKLSGAEKRFFAKWMNLYADVAEMTYNPPFIIKINTAISITITLLGNLALYFVAAESGLSQSSYFAFMAAYGMLMGAFTNLTDVAANVAEIRPIFEMAEPFLKAEPETAENKEIVTEVSGKIEMENVSFRYQDNEDYIIDNLSLKINPGEYVAIVGKTGCGKSTLLRLLLGFEKPEKGRILYDNRDINMLDLPSLRKKTGVVMQDAGVFHGDIFSNIIISAPHLTVDDAWEAAEKAGIADDIRSMPMGMNTILSEGQGGISGGQRQRIMIARAIAPKPKILFFDEATSALDNKTQADVSKALDDMGATRVVIAHRLSTICNCDRILLLENGRIEEEGTYEELMEKGGLFEALVEKQRQD